MKFLPSGFKLLTIAAIVVGIGCAPLLFYIQFGPADGNPIGLGLLAVAGMFGGMVLGGLGVLSLVMQYFFGRNNED